MRISANILKQLSTIELDNKEIADLISIHIGQVEDSHNLEDDYKDIVIAQILESKQHPNADKLGVYMITDGSKTPIQVIAGDKGLKVGDKVAYLRPGSTVPSSIYTEVQPVVISKRKMRDIESNGMLGSEKELNVGTDHETVMRLPEDAPVGQSFSSYYELNDTIIDIENKALTNRGDLFGVLGIARELCAITNQKFSSPTWYTKPVKRRTKITNVLNLKITNDAEILCPRYMAVAFDNIKIQQSPVWLKSFLIKSDIKPLNNIVDITNYISHLLGQPLHAFDYDKILNTKEANINIRMAKEHESILGLDNKLHKLDSETLVITDGTSPVAIAGIIGGKDSEVDSNTKRVILECANFDKTSIRRTSMRLGISTQAATIFKHAINPHICTSALNKATELIKELCDATVSSDIVDIYPMPTKQKTISFTLSDLNSHLGTQLDRVTVEKILTNLEYQVETSQDDNIKVLIPFWRMDIDIQEDIYEDIGRIYGYNNIEFKLPLREISPCGDNKIFSVKKSIRDILSNSGANETDTYSFTSIQNIKKCNQDPDMAFKIRNPIAPELSLMRTSLISSLLAKAEENLQRGYNQFALYEMNIAHNKGLTDGTGLPIENWMLSMIVVDALTEYKTSSYYLAKKYLEKIFKKLNIGNIEYRLISEESEKNLSLDIKNLIYTFDPNTSSLIFQGDKILGIVGEFSNKVKDNFKLPRYSGGIEINLNALVDINTTQRKHLDIPKYPSSIKDLCLEVQKDLKYNLLHEELLRAINTGDLWGEVNCLDIYSESEAAKTKRITFRLTLKNFNKTLSSKDIVKIFEKIEKVVKNKYQATII